MKYYTRKLVKPADLNSHDTLFGGQILKWVDEEAAIYAMEKIGSRHIVTKFMSEIEFVYPAKLGDIIEIGTEVIKFGTSSITLKSVVRIKNSDTVVISVDKIVFVHVDSNGKPCPHGMNADGMNAHGMK